MFWISVEGDEFDAEETTGSWGQKKQFFYGGNPNERPASKRPGKEKEKDNDENELVLFLNTFLISQHLTIAFYYNQTLL